VKEETGATVKPSSIKEYPISYVIIWKDGKKDLIIERRFDYFVCEIEDSYAEPILTDWEIEAKQTFMFVPIDDAIAVNEAAVQRGFGWVENPTYVLRLLLD
jgi:8-oxo-dGTP pyrophosphatase MutT (NUDIX family)